MRTSYFAGQQAPRVQQGRVDLQGLLERVDLQGRPVPLGLPGLRARPDPLDLRARRVFRVDPVLPERLVSPARSDREARRAFQASLRLRMSMPAASG